MITARKQTAVLAGAMLLPAAALSQIPDTLNFLDPGGRSMGMGSASYMTGGDTFASFFNPAGLGYVSQRMIALAFRNLPGSTSVASGDFDDQDLLTDGETGGRGLSHVGFTFPWKGGGTLGFSATLGGYVDDTRTGTGLTSGILTINNYEERIRARADFINLSYGRGNEDNSFNWGVGVVMAVVNVTNRQTGDIFDGASQVGLLDVDNKETGTGFGGIVGFQFSPKGNPGTAFGVSYRTEIDLDNNPNTAGVFDKVPARLSAGFATRRDGLRSGSSDYIVLAADAHHFFEGGSSTLLDRKAHTMVGTGIEYSYVAGFGRLPIRIGYQGVSSGGNNFSERGSMTFGIGYRPAGSDLALDLNFARPNTGGTDMSLVLSFRFK